jgi:basic membrane protein A
MTRNVFSGGGAAICVGLLLALSVGGCGRKPAGHTAKPAAPAGKHIRVAVVTDTGGIGDKSFNEGAWRGAQWAKEQLGVEIKLVESREHADYPRNLRELAEAGYDLIFAVGMLMKDALVEVAPQYPNTKFAIVDVDSSGLPNVVGIEFREQEGGYLAGVLAGLVTKTGKLGFVGGMKLEPVQRFAIGYEAGARTTRPDVRVVTGYTDSFTDVEKGKQLAAGQFDAGADIVFHGSGRCGLGVIEEANERGPGRYAIGVDSDQDYLGCADPEHPQPPGRVLTSVLKRVDNVVLGICRETVEGKFKAGDRRFGVAEGGLALTDMKYTRQDLRPEWIETLGNVRRMLEAGEIAVPSTQPELRAFQPPTVR